MNPPTTQTLARHGLSESDWFAIWTRQAGRCGICGNPPARGGRLVIDHDHKTGRVRGLLHPLCNGKLGKVKDDIVWLDGALRYLQDPPAEYVGIFMSKAHVRNTRRRRPSSS